MSFDSIPEALEAYNICPEHTFNVSSEYLENTLIAPKPYISVVGRLTVENGEFLVVLDNEDRENEGDLIIAASKVTTEKMAFLVRHSSGYVCAPLHKSIADRLELPLMSATRSDRHGTAYTITVDYADGTTTGISAHDRALTARKLADPSTKPDDFMKPGHLLPLRAVEGGVLQRPGHTEAGVDLSKLAGLEPAAVICEIVRDEDGLMARKDDCLAFARKHNLKAITIDDLAKYLKGRANSH